MIKHLLTLGLAGSMLLFTACEQENSSSNSDNNNTSFTTTETNTQYQRVRVSAVAEGLENPWAVAFMPDGTYLVTEKPGRLLHIDGDDRREIGGLPEIQAFRQGGLLDVVLHPDYEENGWVYFTYSKPNGSNETATAVARARISDGELTDMEEIFVQDRFSDPGRHYGSRIAWTNDGYMLVSIGDRGSNPPRAQDTRDHAGTLLRLNYDGSVPDDNPFVGNDDFHPEIFSYGHRNIQGLVVDPETNEIWATDHGPRGGDLLQRVEAGNNYGWPIVTQGLDYRTEGPYDGFEAREMDGVARHFHEFLPTLAPSGLALINHANFGNWQGNLLAGGLRSQRILRILLSDVEVLHMEELFTQDFGRIRDVRLSPEGHVYILTDHSDGKLLRVEAIERS